MRRGTVCATRLTWFAWDVTNLLAGLTFNVTPILWPLAHRAISALDAEMVRRRVWTVDCG